MTAPLRGGIIGCGFFAQFHIDAWRRMSGVEMVAACDPQLERARAAAPNAYADARAMFDHEKLDFVDIATRPDTHAELARMAAERGLAVICQKPMAPTFAEAQQMAATSEQFGTRLMIHENWRWQPWYREVSRRIRAGDIGAPVTYRFRIRKRDGLGADCYRAQPYFRQMPRLLIYETMVHPIDTARFLFGEISSVIARTARRNPLIAGEDMAQLILMHTGGLAGIADGHRFLDVAPDSPPLGDAQFEGEAGSLDVTGTGDVLHNGSLAWKNSVSIGYRGDSVRATQQHFVDCLRSGEAFETSGADYLRTFAAVEAGYRSASSGKAETLS